MSTLAGVESWGFDSQRLASSSEVPQEPVAQPPVLRALLGELREALDSDDLAALDLAGRDQTRAHRHAVQTDRAGTALALLAGVLGAGQAQALAQHEQGLALPHVVGFLGRPVDRGIHTHYATPSV